MRYRQLFPFVGWLGVSACGGGSEEPPEAPEPPSTETGLVSPDAPTLTNCDSSCRLWQPDTGYAYFEWHLTCTYSDPQGPETVQTTGEVAVYQDEAVVGNVSIRCEVSNLGPRCETYFRAEDYGISCNVEPESYRFEYTIYDFDGNSGTSSSTGRPQG